MTKTYCDVCGNEMTDGVFSNEPRKIKGMEDLAGVGDVCKRCHIYGERIRPEKVLLDYWRKYVEPVAVFKEDTDVH